MSVESNAYRVLNQLAQKSILSAQQLPAQVDATPEWSGIGFSLFGVNFVIPMGDLSEMLEVPSFTKLPGVQPWTKGVANVRGRLLPVFDLAAYFGGSLSGHKKQQRLLVIDKRQVYAGLWVDQVFGMHYFPMDSRTNVLPDGLPSAMMGFVDGSFQQESVPWVVFQPLKLLDDSRFLDVALN